MQFQGLGKTMSKSIAKKKLLTILSKLSIKSAITKRPWGGNSTMDYSNLMDLIDTLKKSHGVTTSMYITPTQYNDLKALRRNK